MGSHNGKDGDWHEIVLKFDGFCIECRGKVFAGSGGAYKSGLVKHLVCPPTSPLVRGTYQGVPVSPARWLELCQQVQDSSAGMSSLRMVLTDDRKAYEADGPLGMIRSILGRTRCSGDEAVEIVREWIDTLRVPVDEEKFQKVNQSCRREQPVQLLAADHVSPPQGTTSEQGDGSPTTDVEQDAPVDWDAEG